MGHVANINTRHRLTQIIVLFVAILACMLFSQFADAKPKPPRFDRHKYRVSVHSNSFRVVKVLYWKRKAGPSSTPMMASSRKSKSKAQAETEY